jgi:hypothetical protein
MPADCGKGLLGDLTLVKLIASPRCSDDAGREWQAMASDEARPPPVSVRWAKIFYRRDDWRRLGRYGAGPASRSRSPPFVWEQQLRHAAFEAFGDLLARQIAADEDDAAFTLFVRVPCPLVVTVKDHVHALEHETLIVILE